MTDVEAVEKSTPAILVLEDGAVFEGIACGAPGVAAGEVVFNTSMSGYQEILSDPSYAGQLVTLTSPHIGNYGVTDVDLESGGVRAAGLIVRAMSALPSNHRAEMSLPDWLAANGVVAITDIDTRTLTRHIRDKGVMMAVIVHDARAEDAPTWRDFLAEQTDYDEADLVSTVRVTEPQAVVCRPAGPVEARVEDADSGIQLRPYDPSSLAEGQPADAPHVIVVDFGVKYGILRNLCSRGMRVTLVPCDTEPAHIEAMDPDGIMLSNGPGDPALMDAFLPAVRALTEARPTFGICLGHQILVRAYGGETFKLPFGHRGPNQPVQDVATGRVEMTSQNHGYAVHADQLPDELEVTHVNLNDGTVEGFRHRTRPVYAVQYHPEAGPGPHDAENFFERFARVVRDHYAAR